MSVSKPKRQHTDRTIREKIEILGKLDCGVKAVDGFDGDKPAGSAKRKDRLTLLIITNMDGSDHRKLSVIGKSKTPRCLQKKYKMQVKDMSVDWYASRCEVTVLYF